MTTTCQCGSPRRPHQTNCAACHAAYMRSWRKDHPLTGEARQRANARAYARVYTARGLLPILPCAVCGAAAERHHPDYTQPLQVIWLCKVHHREHHRHETPQAAHG